MKPGRTSYVVTIMMASSVLGIKQGANGMEGRIYMPIIVRSHHNSHLSHGTLTVGWAEGAAAIAFG